MAAGTRIKGITIELDGNTTGLEKSLSDVTKKSIDIQKELKDIDRLLKFDPGNVEALAQKQKLLSEQIINTTEKLNRLKDAESQVEQQFKSGKLGENQYRAFKREIEFTEREINKLNQTLKSVGDGVNLKSIENDFKKVKKSADNTESSVKNVGDELSNIVAGAAAGAGIGEVIQKSLNISSTNTKIDISMELDPESVDVVKDAISNIEAYGVDAGDALEGVRRQWALNRDASDESNAAVVQGAAAIVASYGEVDFTELIQETSELSKNLGISNEDAMALTYSLLKMGFPPDQIDIITEYGTQLKMAGFNAQQIQSIMASGVKTGTWNVDNLLDGLGESRKLLSEFGVEVDKSTSELLSKTEISSQQLQKWGKDVAGGGEAGAKAMQEVSIALLNVQDATTRNALGVKIFGTMWEDQGSTVAEVFGGINQNLMSAEANQNNLNGAIKSLNADPMVQFQKAVGDLVVELTPLLLIVADLISKFSKWVSENPTLAATILAIVSVLGIFLGIVAGLAPIITMLIAIFPALSGIIAAIAGPVTIVIAVIAALIAIGVALYMNWDWVKTKASEVWDFIKEKVSKFVDDLINFFTVTIPETLDKMVQFFKDLPNKIAYALGFVIGKLIQWGIDVISWIQASIPGWIDNITSFFSNLPDKIWTWLVNVVTKLAEWGSNMLSSAKELMNDVIDGIVDTFVNLPGKMWDIGVNVVEGLKNGFKNAWEGMKGWVGGLVDSFVQGTKDALDEGSPSKVMAKIGAFAGEGFAIGIKSTLGLVSDQATAMAEAINPMAAITAPSFNTSTNGNVTANDTVLFAQITVPLDGKIIADRTTPIVVSNISRSQLNRNISKGRG